MKNIQSCDYRYFEERGWFDGKKKYFIDVKVNPAFELIAGIIANMVYRKAFKEINRAAINREQTP